MGPLLAVLSQYEGENHRSVVTAFGCESDVSYFIKSELVHPEPTVQPSSINLLISQGINRICLRRFPNNCRNRNDTN